MTEKEEIINFIFSQKSKPPHRKAFFEENFLLFCLYYFPQEFSHELADFQKQYLLSLQNGENIFFVGFRESGKSMYLTMYYVWVICYKKRRFIMHYNSEIEQAKAMLRDVVTILEENERIIKDFGYIYIPENGRKQRDKKQKSIAEFITENGIKVKAMSIGKSPRGQKFVYQSVTYRPDLVSFDDIDTLKNTKTANIIAEDVNFILGEVFGGVTAYAQIILLGNVIREIGRVPSLKKHFESDIDMNVKIFWIPIRSGGRIAWSRFVATDAEASEKNKNIKNPKEHFISLQSIRRKQGTTGFNQNYNLIPYIGGSGVISRSMVQFYYSLPKEYKVVIGIDGAFSEKNNSDSIGIVVTAHEQFQKENFKYVLEMRELTGTEKNEENFAKFIKNLAEYYHYSTIYIESNNGGHILARILRRHKLSVMLLNSHKDKVTRLLEFQGEIERGIVKFNPEPSKTEKGIEQLIQFPNGSHDDMVDAMVFSFSPALGVGMRLV